MTKKIINTGTAANSKNGDSLRTAFTKINENFTEIYNSTGGLDLLNVASHIIPSATNTYDLGSPTRQWRSLYVSNNTIYLGGIALSIDGSGNLTVGGSRVGATSYTDLTGKPALSTVATTGSYTDLTNRPALFSGSYADLTNKPNLAGTYQFSVAADDSTQRVISTDEVVKFVGAGGITTASDSEGKITITQGTTSSLVNGSKTVSLGTNSTLTLPAPLVHLTNASQLATDTAKIYRATNSTDATAITEAWDTWYSNEWVFRTYVQEDESGRGSNFPWHGMPSWEAYPLIMNWNSQGGPGLPPNPSMAPAAKTAQDSYLSYKELVSSIDIVNGNKIISFNNTGVLSLPGTLEFKDTANAKIILKHIDSYGYVVEDPTLHKTWQFDIDGKLTLPSVGKISNGAYDWTFGTDGIITLPNGAKIGPIEFPNGNSFYSTGTTGYSELNWDNTNYAWVDNLGTTISSTGKNWQFGSDGALTIPGDIKSNGNINIDINLSDSTLRRWQFGEDGSLTLPSVGKINNGAYDWTFGSTGLLTLPAGGTISEGGGISGAIKLTPAGGANAYQALMIYPTGTVEGDHLHLTAGGGTTELYLGNDNHYVKLVNGGNIQVQAFQPTSPYASSAWTFGTDGRLVNLDGLTLTAGGQFNICTIVTSGSGYNTGSALKATTGGSGTGMTVGIGYGLSNQLANVGVVNPGTGYVDGDVITVSGGTGGTFVITRYNEQANQGNNNTVQFDWTFGVDGTLNLPDSISAGNAIIQTTSPINIQVNSNAHVWTFGTDGKLTFPSGMFIESAMGNTLISADPNVIIAIETSGPESAAVLAWIDTDPETSDEKGVSFSTGNGNGSPYAEISVLNHTLSGSAQQWRFNDNGSLTLPAGGEIKTESGTGDVVIEANDGTARTWTFGGAGILSLPDFGATPGSGDGAVGDICRNGDTLYFKTGAGWAAIGMTLI